nr:uncharacterized protein LOC119187671 [Rhipicephalus microplus]
MQLLDTETRTGIFFHPNWCKAHWTSPTGLLIHHLSTKSARQKLLLLCLLWPREFLFSWGDTATSIYHCMFPDSDIAKKFSCGRIKLARIVSDGLGPYFKGQVVTELCQPNVYFSIMIDETPKPELRVQQLDVLVRYFSSSQQEVVVEHVQSFDLGRATAEIIVGCIEEAIADLPKQGLVCFFSDGPNVMKSVRNKLQKHVAPSLIDIGNCNLHKVHNAFGRGLDAFGLDVEEVVRNIYYYFKGAVRSEALRECQDTLGISCHVFLRHVSNRWLTLQHSLCRVEEQFEALRTYFFKGNSSRQRPDTQSLHNKLVSAFSEKQLLAKVLFELCAAFQWISAALPKARAALAHTSR